MHFTILEEINVAQIIILQSLFTNQMLVFDERGKPEYPGENNNKINPHMTSGAEIESGSHWWKASALTTRPTH